MRKRTSLVVGAVVAAGLVVTPSTPAAAALNVVTAGTVVTATLTTADALALDISCVGGTVRVGGAAASPAIACGSVTRIRVVTGDGGQLVDLSGAGAAAFSALTRTEAVLGAGADSVVLSTRSDDVELGTGSDLVTAAIHTAPTGPDVVDLGTSPSDDDELHVLGRSVADDVSMAAPPDLVLAAGPWGVGVAGAEVVRIDLGTGDDAFDGAGVDPSDGTVFLVDGGAGDDELSSPDAPTTLIGGSGANVLLGGASTDSLRTSSPRDIVAGAGGFDSILDVGDGPVGGRSIVPSPDRGQSWGAETAGWTVIRSRGDGARSAVAVALARTGSQDLGDDVGETQYGSGSNLPAERSIFDLEALNGVQQRQRDSSGVGDVVDVVVPVGTWSVDEGTAYRRVTFSAGYEYVEFRAASQWVVRAPYTDPDTRFAHRVLRDLEWRIPSNAERQALRTQITIGGRTRAQVVADLTDTDTYRGLTVDRAFVDVLRRGIDSGGRAYWIDRLDAGLVVRRLRANLYGSPEYLTSQGGGTVPGYVAAAYRDVLGRAAAPSEVTYWVAQITDLGLPRGTIADRFLNTPEARQVVIRDHFVRWADREPTAGEIATWSPLLASSSTDGELALVRALAASSAYYDRPDA